VTERSDQLEVVLSELQAGRVVAIPTDTVYGLAVDPRREGATLDLFHLKGRPETFALPVLVDEAAEAAALGLLDERAAVLVAHCWPGALTIVVNRQPGVELHLGGDPSTIALRCPAHAAVRRLLAASGPLAVTSANRHADPPCLRVADVQRVFGGSLVVFDAEPGRGRPSTVVSLVGTDVRCLREGSVPMTEIEALLGL
jgi:tRNA threonylcarbamoyl adenosine modification protein (Sua5/YciO/YrdC/YwlC family)